MVMQRSEIPVGADARERLAVAVHRVRSRQPVMHAEILVLDPSSDDWIGHSAATYREQILAFYPGTVCVEISEGAHTGCSCRAVIYSTPDGPILVGEAPLY